MGDRKDCLVFGSWIYSLLELAEDHKFGCCSFQLSMFQISSFQDISHKYGGIWEGNCRKDSLNWLLQHFETITFLVQTGAKSSEAPRIGPVIHCIIHKLATLLQGTCYKDFLDWLLTDF